MVLLFVLRETLLFNERSLVVLVIRVEGRILMVITQKVVYQILIKF